MTEESIMNKLDLHTLFKQNIENLPGWGISEHAVSEITKASRCRTDLGAEVYASDSGETRIVPHTCKSRACASCGALRTSVWAGEACEQVPDLPFASVIFTMRGSLWEIFRQNRSLLKALPEIGARVIEDWARMAYGADVAIIVAQHRRATLAVLDTEKVRYQSAAGFQWEAYEVVEKPQPRRIRASPSEPNLTLYCDSDSFKFNYRRQLSHLPGTAMLYS